MNTHKLGGRHTTLSRNPIGRAALDWLTDQTEAMKVLARANLASQLVPRQMTGKVAVQDVAGARLAVRFYLRDAVQDATVVTANEDAAVRLAVKLAQHFALPLPTSAAAVPLHFDRLPPAAPAPASPQPPRAPLAPAPPPLPAVEADLMAGAPAVTSDISVDIRLVSPEVASRWLEGNTRNRPISDAVVKRYADDMRAGRWGLSDSVVAFDRDGRIINGQHRLWAVVDSGVTIRQTVATGYPPEAIAYFDDGYARDGAAVYNLLNPEADPEDRATKTSLSVARRLMGDRWRGKAKGPRQEVFAALDRYRDGIAYACHFKVRGRGLKGIAVSAMLAVIARAYYSADRARLDQFVEVLRSGMMAGPEDSAAVLLRNWLSNNAVNNLSLQDEVYWKTQRALRAFLDREPLVRNLYRAEVEQFPLPGGDNPVADGE